MSHLIRAARNNLSVAAFARTRAARVLANAATGSSLLELQVAFVILTFSVAALGPTVISYLRQVRRLEQRFEANVEYQVRPAIDSWACKLGASATLSDDSPPASFAANPAAKSQQVTILSVVRSADRSEATATVLVEALP